MDNSYEELKDTAEGLEISTFTIDNIRWGAWNIAWHYAKEQLQRKRKQADSPWNRHLGNISTMAEALPRNPCAQIVKAVMLNFSFALHGSIKLRVGTVQLRQQQTIQSLPDGNYRYWSGPANESIVSVESPGNTAFRFRKQGNNITGTFTYVEEDGPGMSVICVQGQVNGNTVSGTATSTPQRASALSTGESFENIDPNGTLAVRRGRLNGFQVRYSSALLNLAKLNRINAGTIVPPKQC